ncbi:MAG: hypothetical protein GF353_05485 [Candidatus Lokiarchaeota archaeon]|nr:hypothetical protein [Candidatus Lokiarchaeota archaeon]
MNETTQIIGSNIEGSDHKKSPIKSFLLIFPFIGLLTVLYGEVWTASSMLWFLDPSIVIVFPLTVIPFYAAHLYFYFNLAVRTRRTSIPQLYLWGTLFGLYEAPITKVIWGSVIGESGAIVIGGIVISEYIMLVFFWHPIFSFITPILVFEIFALNSAKNDSEVVFSNHISFLNISSTKSKIWLLGLTIVGSLFLIGTSATMAIFALITLLINISLVMLFYLIVRKIYPLFKGRTFSVGSLKFTNRGFILLCLFMLFIYVIDWFLFSPEHIPIDPVPIIGIVVSYCLILTLIFLTKPQDPKLIYAENHLKLKHLFIHWFMTIGLIILYISILGIAIILFFLLYFGILVFAPILFGYMILKAFRTG